MDLAQILGVLKEFLLIIVVFCSLLGVAMVKGRYSIINLIFSLYFSFLLVSQFPYLALLERNTPRAYAGYSSMALVVLVSAGLCFLMKRHIPWDDYERFFESLGKKLLVSLVATVLIVAIFFKLGANGSDSKSVLAGIFDGNTHFFWLLLASLCGLFLV